MPKHPPGFFPCAYSASSPDFGVLIHSLLRRARHCSERIADQISGVRQDGELRAKAKKTIGHESILARESVDNRVIGPSGDRVNKPASSAASLFGLPGRDAACFVFTEISMRPITRASD